MECPSLQEWKIENFSCWNCHVHGEYIQSPPFFSSFISHMNLYPKLIDASLSVNFSHNSRYQFAGDVSFITSDGSVISTRHFDQDQSLPDWIKGPTFEEVVAHIEKYELEDQLTLRVSHAYVNGFEQCMCTNIDALKVSFAIDQEFMAEIGTGKYKRIAFIPYSQTKDHEGLLFKAIEKSQRVHFILETKRWKHNTKAILVECRTYAWNKGDTLLWREKKNHVFKSESQWTFPDSMPVKVTANGPNIVMSIKIVNGNVKNSYNNTVYRSKGVRTVPNDTVFSLNDIPKNLSASKLEDPWAVLSQEFTSLFKDQDFSDFKLICEEVTFPVHKNILSARSPVFKRMFLTPMKEAASDSMVIEDLDAPSLARFLVFLYSGKVEDLPCESAIQLYCTADKYDVPTLKKRCVEVLVADISVQNVCDVLSLAHTHTDGKLTLVAQAFILNHFNEVSRSEGWQSYMKTNPSLLLETVTYFAAKDYVMSTTIKDDYQKAPKIAKRLISF